MLQSFHYSESRHSAKFASASAHGSLRRRPPSVHGIRQLASSYSMGPSTGGSLNRPLHTDGRAVANPSRSHRACSWLKGSQSDLIPPSHEPLPAMPANPHSVAEYQSPLNDRP